MGATEGSPDRFYAGLRRVARFWVWFLFRAVVVHGVERVPATGPVLLCINHPNNLIDSLLVGAALPRKVHYLASASLFRQRLLAWFLARAGAIAVYRRQDGSGGVDRNAEMFRAARRALERGQVLAIYPEGTTHTEARVQRIRTGAARIALDYEGARRAAGGAALAPLSVVPVGLSFEARKSFGGRVLVSFGPPLSLAGAAARMAEDPAGAVAAATDAIQAAMEAEVVHVDRIDAAEVVRAVEELYRDDLVRELREARGLAPDAIDAFRLSRSIVEAVAYFKTRDPERVAGVWGRIQRYRALLAAYRVRDQAVRARLEGAGPRHPFRTSWRAVIGFPLFAYGAAVNALPYLLPRWLSRRYAQKETDYATIRLLSSIVAFPLFWGAETWAVWRLLGPGAALGFALSLPLSGLAAYRYLRGAGRLRAQTRFARLALTQRHAAARLLAERQAIVDALDQAKQEFVAAGRVPVAASGPGMIRSKGESP